ncbi:MAG: CoA ester lyase [Candidatus Rokuibacteriota bacterium]|nr:MAG: CoA ester lyase [Candidatus Rokubacteria bacterium]
MSSATGTAARIRRSCLAVPGSSEKKLAKAAMLPADQVFLDLEDAVVPERKDDATRQQVVAALRDADWRTPTRAVRVNAVGTPWCLDDLLTVVGGAGERLHCVVVPKVESAAQIHFVEQLLAQLELKHELERPIGIEVQIESPRGLVELERIAAASPRIETLIFGPGDYAASTGMPQLSVGEVAESYPGYVWHYVLARIVTVAHAFALQAIDGPFAAIRDLDGVAESARRSRVLGYDGKWALHPDQIDICNEIYRPTQAEFDRVERIIDEYRDVSDGAVVFEGEMIDEASRKMALSVVERGRAAGMTRSAES